MPLDIGNSIEITLVGSVHDGGVDISLFRLEPLTPTTSASTDLARSSYQIGGNGFQVGSFLSWGVSPALPALPVPSIPLSGRLALVGLLLASGWL